MFIVIKGHEWQIEHCPDNKDLVAWCRALSITKLIPVDYPTSIEIVCIPNIVQRREEEAICRFKLMVEKGEIELL